MYTTIYLHDLQQWHLHWPCIFTVWKLQVPNSVSIERERASKWEREREREVALLVKRKFCKTAGTTHCKTPENIYFPSVIDQAEMILLTTLQTFSSERFGVFKFFQRLSMTRHQDFSIIGLKLKHANTLTLSFGVPDLLKGELSSHFQLGHSIFLSLISDIAF